VIVPSGNLGVTEATGYSEWNNHVECSTAQDTAHRAQVCYSVARI